MFKSMLGFITGVILLYCSGDLINNSKDSLNYYVNLQIVLFSISFFLFFYDFISKEKGSRHFAVYFLFLCLGFSYASFVAEKQISSRISSSYDQQIIQVDAYLCGLPREGEYSFSADFCILGVRSIDGSQIAGDGFKARLRWPLNMKISSSVSTFYIKSRQPKSTVNFVGSSFESNFLYEGIVLTGRIQEHVEMNAMSTMGLHNRVLYEYHQLRNSISQHSNAILEGLSHKGVISALLLGDRSQISVTDYKVLANTGTQHLIAISGLHVGLVMLGVFCLLPRSAFSIVFVSILGMAYVLLVGFTPSAQRAWVMCVCALIYLSGYIKQSKWKPFVIALFLVLVYDPLATLNLGFWYSFLCVAIIFTFLQFTLLNLRHWLSLLLLQFFLIVALIPISSLLGSRHGVENILANMLAIPWVSLLVLPLTLFGFILSFFSEEYSAYILRLLNLSVELLTSYLSSLKMFFIPVAIEPQALPVISFVLGFIAILVFNKVKPVVFAGILALMLAVFFPSKLYRDDSELMVFDVGQGLALAIKSKGSIWLYDTGPAFNKSSSTTNVILPYLRRHRKENEFAGMIVSHGDADHAGDLLSLYDEFIPRLEWSGQPNRLDVKGFRQCEAGMRWNSKEVLIEVLYPFPYQDLSDVSSNNHSCVVRLSFMGKVFLLMGDLETDAELKLVKFYRHKLKADVLVAGHHGASQSSSFALLKHVKPEYIVFSAGYLNKFGHPARAVLERVYWFNSIRLNTAVTGALSFKLANGSSEFTVSTAR